MKHIIFICLLAVTVAGCKKSLQNESSAQDISVAPTATPTFIPAPPYRWRDLGVPILTSDPRNEAEMSNSIFTLNGDNYLATGFRYRKVFKFNASSKSWDRVSSMSFETVFNEGRRFVFGSKIYHGMTYENPHSFWAYDPFTNTNTPLADFPGTPVDDPTLFVFSGKGYLVSGISRIGNQDLINQYWEYNFLTNQWKNKGSSPIGIRGQGSAYAINDKVYIGLGFTWTYVDGQRTKRFYNDWTQIDPGVAGFSASRASFPGEARRSAKGFMIGSTLHLGFGKVLTEYRYDLYKYNASLNTWTAVQSWPSVIEGIYGASWTDGQLSMFGVGSAGYLVKGGLNEFWTFSNAIAP
jgi:N-acetylneuraminic acid mutarotase